MNESELYKSLGESTAETNTKRVVRIHCLGVIRAALFFLTFATVFHIIYSIIITRTSFLRPTLS